MNTRNIVGKKNITEILKAVLLLPLAFSGAAFVTAYFLISPHTPLITSLYGLMSTQSAPIFNKTLDSILDQSSDVSDNADEDPEETSSETATTAEDEHSAENTDETDSAGDTEEIEDITPEDMGTVDISAITMPKYEQHYANLKIDVAAISCKLYYGDSNTVLKYGAGQYMGSRMPGFGQPILVAAHNNTYFKNLGLAKVGTVVKIETGYGVYKYKVYETKISKYNDSTAYDLTLDEEILILYTCYPFNSLGFKTDRYFVFAKKISGPAVNW